MNRFSGGGSNHTNSNFKSVTIIGAGWRNPMGEKIWEALKLRFDKRLRLERFLKDV
jgi:hypothetical protein